MFDRKIAALSCISACTLLGLSMTPAFADAIPYPNTGTQAPAHSFFASATGELDAYFYGSTAAYEETLGVEVNGVQVASGLLDNKSTGNGTKVKLADVTEGDALTFFINVKNTGDTFYSDPLLNGDGVNHAYTTSFSGDSVIKTPGTFVGFEDLPAGQSDFNYNDETFVFTNASSVSTVPLPASAPMFGAALLALGAFGYGVKRKKAAAAG